MNDPKPQPWHEADEKPQGRRHNAPLGTHSLTGGRAEVGLPPGKDDAKRDHRPDEAVRDDAPAPLAEPRAGGGDLLGPRR